MRSKNSSRDCPRFEQAETQEHRVPHTAPNGPDGVAARGDPLNEHRIDGDAHKDQHPLESNGKQGLQIVLAHATQLPVGEGRHRQRGQTCEQVNLNHAPVDDDENHDVQRPHGYMNEERLEPQSQQSAKAHGFQTCLQRVDHGGRNVR